MNSLPFISHHLFVAAISNEDWGREKPARHLKRFAAPADRASPIALGMMEAQKLMPVSPTGKPLVRIARAGT